MDPLVLQFRQKECTGMYQDSLLFESLRDEHRPRCSVFRARRITGNFSALSDFQLEHREALLEALGPLERMDLAPGQDGGLVAQEGRYRIQKTCAGLCISHRIHVWYIC